MACDFTEHSPVYLASGSNSRNAFNEVTQPGSGFSVLGVALGHVYLCWCSYLWGKLLHRISYGGSYFLIRNL